MQLPNITLKVGMSLDAKLATSCGESKWITSELARADARELRKNHAGILVGSGTVIADDPGLLVNQESSYNPIRIILDTNLVTPLTAKVVTDNKVQSIIFVSNNVSAAKIALFAQFALVKIIQIDAPQLELSKILPKLFKLGITSILVEGGPRILSSFMQQCLYNQLVMYVNPQLIGGGDRYGLASGLNVLHLADSLKLTIKELQLIGGDIKIIALAAK
ncbi:MAG: RibD family protein [Burkholderiales bacterium]|nr:RibD family protein [Burkholderiales bacterium]